MSPWIQVPQGGGAPPPHVCSPPRRWPGLSRRRHLSGAVWECESVVLSGVRGETQGCCGRRWRLEWLVHENPCGADPSATPVWTEVGRGEVARVGEGGAPSEQTPDPLEQWCFWAWEAGELARSNWESRTAPVRYTTWKRGRRE